MLVQAKEAAEQLRHFTFEAFENKLYGTDPTKEDVPSYYHAYIKKLEQEEIISTASNYTLSLKSLLRYHQQLIGKRKEKLYFITITPDWLEGFERWMLKEGKSTTTVGIYLRPLRAILI